MTCVKNGAQLLLEPYGEYVVCDAYEHAGLHYFRITRERSFSPPRPDEEIYLIVEDWEDWFDQNGNVSTMIARKVRAPCPE